MLHILSLLLLTAVSVGGTNVLKESCSRFQRVCNLSDVVIETRQTMTLYRPGNPDGKRVRWRKKGFYYQENCNHPEDKHTLNKTEFKEVIFGDGTVKYITTLNRTFPGPTFVVYEGQIVMINFTNKFKQQGTSVHFHGMFQIGTPYMDGVTGISQCPINPGETFTYVFTANPVGTFFYHSHTGLQRDDGLFGAFIVWPNKTAPDNELLMMVDDYYPLPAVEMFTSLYYGVDSYLYPGCMNSTGYRTDSSFAGVYQFYSALVNGKGRRYDDEGNPIVKTPMEIYNVMPNKTYNFRLISASSAFAFKISIDEHDLLVTHTETGAIKPQKTQSIIVNVAERFEFSIRTKHKSADTSRNYWIRVETLETKKKTKDDTFIEVPNKHFTLAILRYKGDEEPTTNATNCTNDEKCKVVNCPFRSVNSSVFDCINVCQLELRNSSNFPERLKKVDKEFMFAFKFTPTRFVNGTGKNKRGSINGRMLQLPLVPPPTNFNANFVAPCHPDKVTYCDDKTACRCTNEVNIVYNQSIQFILFSNGSHPIHLHGHSYYVVKVGYPKYNSSTNEWKHFSTDIECDDTVPNCNKIVWANSKLANGSHPDANIVNPVRKDTVAIPAGGYVVIRFISDNPGWWIFHCHIDVHLEEGMGLMITEGNKSQFPPTPINMHKCGNTLQPVFRKYKKKKVKTVTLKNGRKKKIIILKKITTKQPGV